MKSYVEYWKEKEESNSIWAAAQRVHTVATWQCGCQLGYSALGYSPLHRCDKHNDPWTWFGIPYPPEDQLADAEKAGILTVSRPQ